MNNQDGDEFFLDWIHGRLIQVHGENKNVDYMLRLRKIIDRMSEMAAGKTDDIDPTPDFILNDKPEWKQGDLPADGTKCEGCWKEENGDMSAWHKVTFKRGFDSKLWFSCNMNEYVIPAHDVTFRPILSERDKVIKSTFDMLKSVVFSGDFSVSNQHMLEILEKTSLSCASWSWSAITKSHKYRSC